MQRLRPGACHSDPARKEASVRGGDPALREAAAKEATAGRLFVELVARRSDLAHSADDAGTTEPHNKRYDQHVLSPRASRLTGF